MSWNYAIGVKTVDGEKVYGIVEEYHTDFGHGWTDLVKPEEESPEALLVTLKRMVKAVENGMNTEPLNADAE